MFEKVVAELNKAVPGAILAEIPVDEDDRLQIDRLRIKEVCRTLKTNTELDFKLLADLTCVDYLGEEERFELIYQLFSLSKKYRLRLKVRLPEEEQIDTVSDVWRVADPLEREVYDMFGVRFRGHPNLRRILLYEEFEGHPLRKDYPLKQHQPIVSLRAPIEPGEDPPYNWTRFQRRRKLEVGE